MNDTYIDKEELELFAASLEGDFTFLEAEPTTDQIRAALEILDRSVVFVDDLGMRVTPSS
jgi:hypothetical protein